ncbi:hypothetical protein CSOJ01_04009 [Colletotrichum sojae]|uniref:Uncharacterized protein n=1 Tax=Colletotrichum sojae TaxID=2175907 RepID=A0A8H6MZX5_9PEZI|nr:hypothetical protein CSOJ01_04009 [Colletotrichum sojae]
MDMEGPSISEVSDELARLSLREAVRSASGCDVYRLAGSPLQWTNDDLKALRCSFHELSLEQLSPVPFHPVHDTMDEKEAVRLGRVVQHSPLRPARATAMESLLENLGLIYLSMPHQAYETPVTLPCETFELISERGSRVVGDVDYYAVARSREAKFPESAVNQFSQEAKAADPHLRNNFKMRVYRAIITDSFLAKVKSPNRVPTASPEQTQLKISYVNLQYWPVTSLCWRLLQALFECD